MPLREIPYDADSALSARFIQIIQAPTGPVALDLAGNVWMYTGGFSTLSGFGWLRIPTERFEEVK